MDLLNKKYEMDVCGEDTDVVIELIETLCSSQINYQSFPYNYMNYTLYVLNEIYILSGLTKTITKSNKPPRPR